MDMHARLFSREEKEAECALAKNGQGYGQIMFSPIGGDTQQIP